MKKKIAIVLAVVMAMSVFAIPASAVYQLDGTGGVVWVDTEVLRIQLPTSKSFEFTLDPYGLLDLEPGVPVDLDDLKDLDGAGKIVFHDFVPVVLNKSSREIRVGVEFTIDTGDSDVAAIANTTWTDEDQQINMTVDAAKDKVTSAPFAGDLEDDFDTVTGGHIMETARWLEFIFDRADYEIELNEDAEEPYTSEDYAVRIKDEDDNAAGTALQLDGSLNDDADWSDAAEVEIELAVVFAFEMAAGSTLNNKATVKTTPLYGFEGVETDPMAADFEREDEFTLDSGAPGFVIGGTVTGTATNAIITGTVGSTLNIPFNFGSDVETGFPQVWLQSPIADVSSSFVVTATGFTFNTTGAPAGTYNYTVWLETPNSEATNFFALRIILS